MNSAYVVQFSDEEHPFIDRVYCVTETLEDAIIISEAVTGMDGVFQAGYEKVEYIASEDTIEENSHTISEQRNFDIRR